MSDIKDTDSVFDVNQQIPDSSNANELDELKEGEMDGVREEEVLEVISEAETEAETEAEAEESIDSSTSGKTSSLLSAPEPNTEVEAAIDGVEKDDKSILPTPHQDHLLLALQSKNNVVGETSLGSAISGSNSVGLSHFYNYPVTLCLIFSFHYIFYKQWKKRTSRKSIEMTYQKTLIQRKYHIAFWSFFSHFSTPDGSFNNSALSSFLSYFQTSNSHEHEHHDSFLPTTTSTSSTSSSSGQSSGVFSFPSASSLTFSALSRRFKFYAWKFSRILRQLIPLLNPWSDNAPFSGVLLVIYTSHLLWQVRALEEYFNISLLLPSSSSPQHEVGSYELSKFGFMRTIFILMILVISIELGISRYLIGKERREQLSQNNFLIYTKSKTSIFPQKIQGYYYYNRRSSTTANMHISNFFLHRGTFTFTPIITALLFLYSRILPYTPITILPFFFTGNIVNLGTTIPFVLSLLLLFSLSFKRNKMGIFVGLFAGDIYHTFIHFPYKTSNTALSYFFWDCLILVLLTVSLFSFYVDMTSINLDGSSEASRMDQLSTQHNNNNNTAINAASNNNTKSNNHFTNVKRWLPCIDYVGWNQHGILTEDDDYIQVWRDHQTEIQMDLDQRIQMEQEERRQSSASHRDEAQSSTQDVEDEEGTFL